MKIGYTTMNTPADIAPRVLGPMLEDAGFDSIWIGEHSHIPVSRATPYPTGGDMPWQYTTMMDPFISLTQIGEHTTNLLLGLGVALPLEHDVLALAKTAATLDVLSNGRLQFGVGVGWNEIEFQGLGEDFKTRGKRSEEQVRFMQALWKEPHVTFKGEFHQLDDGGINPRPKSGRVPIWFGGHAEATFRRTAQYGDGFMPLAWPAGDKALSAFDKLRTMIKAAGRDPKSVGLDV